MNELLWVAVPGGLIERSGAREAVLRVLVVPRLDGGSLAAAGMASWPPPSLVNATLKVGFAESAAAAAGPEGDIEFIDVEPPHIQAQPGVWEAFFGPDTIVHDGAHARRRAVPAVEVDSTSKHADAIDTTFNEAARARVAFDPGSQSDLETRVREQLDEHWTLAPEPVPPPPGERPSPRVEAPDFHRTISMLREHPAVLRALGLVIELRFPQSRIPSGLRQGVVEVLWPEAVDQPALPPIVSPWTQYGREFLPRSTTNVSAGMVTLSPDPAGPSDADNGEPRWGVVTVDVDGGAGRLRDAGRAIGGRVDGASPAEGSPATLPALRTAGLQLVRRGRRDDFEARRGAAERNAVRESMENVELNADDLVLGYRIDIKPVGGEWFSLHERDATYGIGTDLTIGAASALEEGHLKPHAAVDDGNGALRADEVVARWSGWSLAVPPPPFDTQPGQERPARRGALPFDFRWTFNVRKGSLPRLRFTGTYFMRARVADMAGGGLDLDDPAADRCATEAVVFRRYEPVASPSIRLADGVEAGALGPGESIFDVVIRSDADISVADFAAANPRYAPNPGRVLLSPRASLTMAERHGELDRHDDERTFELVQRAVAQSTEPEAALPDPATGGVTAFPLRERGGIDARMAERAWPETKWPEFEPKSIELSAREGRRGQPVVWDEDLLKVRLAPAEQVTLELSTFLRPDFLDQFAIKDPMPQESESAAILGRHPMLTPAVTMRFVHAVRRPIDAPEGSLSAAREANDTFVRLTSDVAMFGIDPKSTAKLEITAAWTERNDEKLEEISGAPVQSVIVHRGDEALEDALFHEFGDTRHRTVTYTVSAISRFRQFFHADEDDEAFIAPTVLPQAVLVPNSARPAPPVVISTRPAFVWEEERHTDGGLETVRRRRRGGRLRVELQRPWFQTGDGEQLAVVVTAEPEPPEELWRFITQVGRDPIWDTEMPERWPSADMFRSASATPTNLLLEGSGAKVFVVPHDVWFNEDRWYADVELADVAASSYRPFVELAVARYQPSSLEGRHLSQIVKTEMLGLLPDRTLTVKRSADNVLVSLEGPGPVGPLPNRVDVMLEQCTPPVGTGADAVMLTALEPPDDGTVAWVPVPGQARQADLGAKDIPLSIPPSVGPLRIRVREIELIGPDGPPPTPQPGTGTELAEHTVFTDVLVLPTS